MYSPPISNLDTGDSKTVSVSIIGDRYQTPMIFSGVSGGFHIFLSFETNVMLFIFKEITAAVFHVFPNLLHTIILKFGAGRTLLNKLRNTQYTLH